MTDRGRQLRQAFVGGFALFLVSVVSLSGYSLWRLRSEAIADSLQVAALHSRSFENFLTQSLRVAEQSASNITVVGTDRASLERLEATFTTALRQTPFLRSMSLQDASGRIVASSNRANIGITVATQDYLPIAGQVAEILRIGQPWRGRDFSNGRLATPSNPVEADAQGFVPLTRSVGAGGQALSLLIAINPDYFINTLVEALDSESDQVDVLRYDGVLLMGTAANTRAGTSHEKLVKNLQLSTRESGRFEQIETGTAASLTAFRVSRLYPFVVITRLDRDLALAQWRTEARALIGVLTPTLLAIVLMATAFYRRLMDGARQRAETERLLRINATVFDASSEAIIITDANGNIISANGAFTRITGYTEQEVTGRNPRLLASGLHGKPFFADMWSQILASGTWSGEVINQRKDGGRFDAHLSVNTARDRHGHLQHYVGVIADITERKHSESIVMELNRDFVSFLENTSDFIYFKDSNSRFRFASQTLANITGHVHWRDMIGKHDREVFPAQTARIYEEEERPIFQNGTPLLNQVDPYFDAAGNKGWVSTSKWPLFDPDGKVEGLFGISRDVTVHKLNEEKLELAASVFHTSREGITITRTDGSIVDVNEAFTQITGYSRDEVLGKNPRILSSGRHTQDYYQAMWRSVVEKGHWYGEIWNRRKDGEVYAEMITISTVRDAQGQAQHYVALFSDITKTKQHEQQLEHIAHFDALTNLPNRVLLADRLKQAMLQAERRAQRLAVVFLDLDGFKMVNDTHGHEAGDQLLMALAIRMKDALREGDTLARIGGDEFVAVLVDLRDATESMPMLNRLLSAASAPVHLNGVDLQVSASLGVTLYPQEEELDADQLQRQADQAMYQAKVSGKNRYHFFDAIHDRSVRDHHESLERVRAGLAGGEMVLLYQPKVNMRTGKVVGVEALIRWQHPDRGMLAPGVFLPIIENQAMAIDLDEWVIDAALSQMQAWQDAGLPLRVSINLGARLLQQHDFVQRIQAILAVHPGVDPQNIELEVLETSALQDMDRVSQSMQAGRELGLTFSLDDFGTGYSSLAYVKRLPVSQLKIDQSFVHDMLADKEDMAILRAVMGLAVAFQQEVIAEGVETAEHGVALMQLGCDFGQGYFISRPMPANEIPGWIKSWKRDPAWLGQTRQLS